MNKDRGREPLTEDRLGGEPLVEDRLSGKPLVENCPGGFDFKTLYSLRNVTSLDLSSRGIARIPMLDLPNLENLQLRHNLLTSTTGLLLCTALHTISFAHNRIRTVSMLEMLGKLQTLDLTSNRIRAPEQALRTLSVNPSLSTLQIQGNPCAVGAYWVQLRNIIGEQLMWVDKHRVRRQRSVSGNRFSRHGARASGSQVGNAYGTMKLSELIVEQTAPRQAFMNTQARRANLQKPVGQPDTPQKRVGQTGPQKPVGQAGPQKRAGQTGPQKPVDQTGPQKPVGQTGPQKPVGQTGSPQKPAGQTGSPQKLENRLYSPSSAACASQYSASRSPKCELLELQSPESAVRASPVATVAASTGYVCLSAHTQASNVGSPGPSVSTCGLEEKKMRPRARSFSNTRLRNIHRKCKVSARLRAESYAAVFQQRKTPQHAAENGKLLRARASDKLGGERTPSGIIAKDTFAMCQDDGDTFDAKDETATRISPVACAHRPLSPARNCASNSGKTVGPLATPRSQAEYVADAPALVEQMAHQEYIAEGSLLTLTTPRSMTTNELLELLSPASSRNLPIAVSPLYVSHPVPGSPFTLSERSASASQLGTMSRPVCTRPVTQVATEINGSQRYPGMGYMGAQMLSAARAPCAESVHITDARVQASPSSGRRSAALSSSGKLSPSLQRVRASSARSTQTRDVSSTYAIESARLAARQVGVERDLGSQSICHDAELGFASKLGFSSDGRSVTEMQGEDAAFDINARTSYCSPTDTSPMRSDHGSYHCPSSDVSPLRRSISGDNCAHLDPSQKPRHLPPYITPDICDQHNTDNRDEPTRRDWGFDSCDTSFLSLSDSCLAKSLIPPRPTFPPRNHTWAISPDNAHCNLDRSSSSLDYSSSDLATPYVSSTFAGSWMCPYQSLVSTSPRQSDGFAAYIRPFMQKSPGIEYFHGGEVDIFGGIVIQS